MSPGEEPKHFKDRNGREVKRTAGSDRQTYKWDHEEMVVTFGGAAGGGQAGADRTPAGLAPLS